MIYTNTFAQYEKILHQKYVISSTIRHKGERGRQRENGLANFLGENLPEAYGVATGEVIPYRGPTPSPQCDVIVYDRLRMPILGRSDAVQQVPLEAVYSIIECKSLIDHAALADTKNKIQAIRGFPRCPSKAPLRTGRSQGPFFTLFGFRLKSSVERCTEFMSQTAVNNDVDLVALDRGCGVWIDGRREPVWVHTTEAGRGVYETLLVFFIGLLATLSTVDLGEPPLLDMFWSKQ